jgi:flagellin
MSSILTNNSAMVALQTLNGINRNLGQVQDQISTGKKVATAKDNAAVWAISSVMESDVGGFKAISDSLSLGASSVATASQATDTIKSMLGLIRDKIIAAQGENVNRGTLQDELSSLRDEIGGIVSAAQVNGLNMLSNRETDTSTANIVANVKGSGGVDVLASLDRASDGSVTAGHIAVGKQDLGTDDLTFGTGTDLAAAAFAGAGAIADGATGTLTVAGDIATAARDGNRVLAGDSYRIAASTFGTTDAIEYVARDGDTVEDIASALASRANYVLEKEGVTGFTVSANGGAVSIENNSGAGITSAVAANSGGQAGGGLETLGDLDISTEDGAKAALSAIEGLIQTTIKAGAAFGTSENRLEIQNDFVSKLTDSMKSGIGALVDADLEEASARLQALQVQQQLGVQALSIANQTPQTILSLFR